MRIVVAQHAGFCPGVNLAIDKVIELASKSKKRIVTLGQIIHNNEVIQELEKQGIKAVDDIDEIEDPQNTILVIRAHGIPPQLEQKIKEKNIDYVDATCPLVKNLHRIIQRYREEGYKTIIFGDKNHAEVIGLIGYAGEECIVISSIEEAEKLPQLEKVNLVSQTTQEEDAFLKVAKIVKKKAKELIVSNTICEPTKNRQRETKTFASQSDLVIVVGGKHSANTKRLYEICKSLSKKAVLVENETEITPDLFENVETLFITAGASTPKWMIDRVGNKVKKLTTKKDKISLIIDYLISSGVNQLISFASVIKVSSELLKIKLDIFHIIPSISALTFAHLVNRVINIKDDVVRKTLLDEYSKTTKISLFILGIISLILSLQDIVFATMIISFNLASILYKKISSKRLRISKDIAISLGWLYIFVAVPSAISKSLSLKEILITSLFILSLAGIRNKILKLLYLHSDAISEKKAGLTKNINILFYLSLIIITVIPFLYLPHIIAFYFFALAIYYAILHITISSKKIPLTQYNELLVDIPFVCLLAYLILR